MENKENASGQLLKTKSEFDIADSALACMMFILLSIAFSIFLVVSGIKVVMSSFAYFALHVLVESIFAIAAFFVSKIKRRNLIEAAGMNKKFNVAIVGWCLLLAFLTILCFGSLTNVFIAFLEHFGFSSDDATIEIANIFQYLGMLVSSCFVAAISEEILFRGVILSGFKKWGVRVAVGFSALIFMLMHGSALQTVHQFIVGVVVGYVFYKTHNLWIGVIIHFFNNFIPITQVFLLTLSSTEETTEVVAQSAGLGSLLVDFIFAIFVAWAGWFFIKRIIDKIVIENEKINGKQKEKEAVTSIVVDGAEQEVEITIDGENTVSGEEKTHKECEKISGGTIAMFSIAGLYLIFEWIINTVSRFM